MKKIIKLPRSIWKINPKTRIKESKKIYNRKEIKKQTKKYIDEELQNT